MSAHETDGHCRDPDGCDWLPGVASSKRGRRKLATLSGASTRRYYGSSVRLYKIAHQRQTDAQPGARAVICLIRLPKQIEYAW